MTRILALAATLVLCAGCFTGRVKDESPWDLSVAEQLVVGTSTRADVLRLLGAPTEVVRLHQGEALVYEHAVSKRSGFSIIIVSTYREDTQRDAVVVLLEKGVVAAVGTRKNADKASFGTPWGD